MKSRFRHYIKLLNPDPAIGGLEIADGALRFVLLRDDGSVEKSAFAALPAGAVRGGIIQDEAAFRAAALLLRRSVGGFRAMPVVVSLPPGPVYSQIFAVPYARESQLEEAARLNLRMISPLDFDSAYADWQKTGAEANADGSFNALGAFVDRRVADLYCSILGSVGFLPVAVEFASLSLARATAHGVDKEDEHEPYVVVSLTGDGMTILAVQGGVPQFTEFSPWSLFSGGEASGQVTLERFHSVLGAALRRFMNFYRGRFHTVIKKALVVNATSNKETAEWIKNEFSLETFSLSGYESLPKEWCVASGAALRGIVPRADDAFISLSRVGTEDEFERSHVRRFIGLWRAVVLAVLVLTVFIYVVLDLLMIRRERMLSGGLYGEGPLLGNREVAALAVQADNFNNLAEKAYAAALRAVPQSKILRAIYTAAGSDITVSRLELDAASGTILIRGTAATERGVIAFKGILANTPQIAEVSLPLSAITTTPDGAAAFTATIILKK
jgi:hypothetical protein